MKRYIIAAALLVAVVWLTVIFFVDPANVEWMPKCLFKMATGFDCPGCGAQRAAYQLLHLNFAEAWRCNPLLLLFIPYLGLLFFLEYGGGKKYWPRLYDAVNSSYAGYILLVVIVAYWILRNVYFC